MVGYLAIFYMMAQDLELFGSSGSTVPGEKTPERYRLPVLFCSNEVLTDSSSPSLLSSLVTFSPLMAQPPFFMTKVLGGLCACKEIGKFFENRFLLR